MRSLGNLHRYTNVFSHAIIKPTPADPFHYRLRDMSGTMTTEDIEIGLAQLKEIVDKGPTSGEKVLYFDEYENLSEEEKGRVLAHEAEHRRLSAKKRDLVAKDYIVNKLLPRHS